MEKEKHLLVENEFCEIKEQNFAKFDSLVGVSFAYPVVFFKCF